MQIFGIQIGKKSVDGVLSAFNTAIADLKTVAQNHANKAEKHALKAVKANQAKEAAAQESTRALTIAAQMEKVFQ